MEREPRLWEIELKFFHFKVFFKPGNADTASRTSILGGEKYNEVSGLTGSSLEFGQAC